MNLLNSIFFTSLVAAVLSWLLPGKLQLRIISLITLVFMYLYAEVSLVILFITAASNYFILHTAINIPPKLRLVLCLLCSAGTLLFFKSYIAIAAKDAPLIPLGLSYYLFRQIHYAFEVYKKKLASHSAEEYFTYLFFLPVILVGPINRFPEFLKDMRRRRWDASLVSSGLQRCLYGYAKIVIVGNYFFTNKMQQLIDSAAINHQWLANYLDIIRFPLNAYFQFAGYSDIAIGLSAIMGFRIMENFNNPFLSENLNEFWKKYHISLSAWCRDYVFTPMASYTRKVYAGILLSMLVLSLWHEISWYYLAWGVVQAAGIVASNYFAKYKVPLTEKSRLHFFEKGLKALLVFHFFAFSCILIKENNWQLIIHKYKLLLQL